MSSVKKLKPKIHEIYTDTYRLLRQYYKHPYIRLVSRGLAPGYVYHRALASALITIDNKNSEFDGWQNPLRKRQFVNVKNGFPWDYDIPF